MYLVGCDVCDVGLCLFVWVTLVDGGGDVLVWVCGVVVFVVGLDVELGWVAFLWLCGLLCWGGEVVLVVCV